MAGTEIALRVLVLAAGDGSDGWETADATSK